MNTRWIRMISLGVLCSFLIEALSLSVSVNANLGFFTFTNVNATFGAVQNGSVLYGNATVYYFRERVLRNEV